MGKMNTSAKETQWHDRLQTAQERVEEARKNAKMATARVTELKRKISREERRKRTHLLVRMGAAISSLGVETPEEFDKFIPLLRSWSFTDKASGAKTVILDDVLQKIRATRPR